MNQRLDPRPVAICGRPVQSRNDFANKFKQSETTGSGISSARDMSPLRADPGSLHEHAQVGSVHEYTDGVDCIENDITSEVTPTPPLFLLCLALGMFFGLAAAVCAFALGMRLLPLIAVYSAVGSAVFLASAVVLTLLSSENCDEGGR
jgi:hypothetical protein